ncbi:MAG: hypothetical protein M0027_01520 [Candidatus Dormibacteraeota bacterium]|jgi:hypothetical protein|nr:hypothetical protein [Candidatus Dormibacteraeota bacterium]
MQIHFVEVQMRDRYVLDEHLGPVKRREQVLQPSSIDRINHKGQTYEVQDDLTFHVPDDVGREILAMRPDCHSGPNPFAVEAEMAPNPVEPVARPRRAPQRRAR